jgi:hypothetical protein
MKKRVKFMTSIAGLADPDKPTLDRRYERIMQQARDAARKASREFKEGPVKLLIAEHKKADRYDDVQRGFKRDFSYKTGDEAVVPAEVAIKWEEDGICTILADDKKAA